LTDQRPGLFVMPSDSDAAPPPATLPPTIGDKIVIREGDQLGVVAVISKRSRAGEEMAVVLAAPWGELVAPLLVIPASELVWVAPAGCWQFKQQSRIIVPR